jgi:magnesium chelatase family protein
MSKLSGPLVDRIDLHVRVKNLSFAELNDQPQTTQPESSASIRERVLAAQTYAQARQGKIFNAHLNVDQIKAFCVLSEPANNLLAKAFERLSLSARAYHRILRVSRTIADLAQSPTIEQNHIREAIMLRLLDKQQQN